MSLIKGTDFKKPSEKRTYNSFAAVESHLKVTKPNYDNLLQSERINRGDFEFDQ